MKTLIVWDDGTGEKFAIVEGDYSRFHKQTIGLVNMDPDLEQEMLEFFFTGPDHSELRTELFEEGPLVIKPQDLPLLVVCCGFAL